MLVLCLVLLWPGGICFATRLEAYVFRDCSAFLLPLADDAFDAELVLAECCHCPQQRLAVRVQEAAD